MDEFARKSPQHRLGYIREAAAKRGVREMIIEKDF